MNELTLPFRNLMARPIRSALTTLGVAISVAGFIALTGLTQGLRDSFAQGIEEPGGDLIISQRDSFSLISSSIPDSLGPAIAGVEGIAAVSGILLNIATIDNDANIVVSGWEPGGFLWNNLRMVKGHVPDASDAQGVVLGESIANALRKSIGDSVELQFQTFTIVGVAAFGSTLNQNIAIVNVGVLQQLLGREGTVTLYEVLLRRPLDPGRIDAARARLAAVIGKFEVSNTGEFTSNIRFFNIVQSFASTISIIILAMALLAVANTLLMAVSERTHEIGILAAIGWTPMRILSLILMEGTIMTAAGAIAGVGIGILAMRLVAGTHVASGLLEPYISAGMIEQALGSVFLIGPLGSLYPAWRAIRLQPAEALRAN